MFYKSLFDWRSVDPPSDKFQINFFQKIYHAINLSGAYQKVGSTGPKIYKLKKNINEIQFWNSF